MKIIVFDTETTGFPLSEVSLEEQPYIVQFASITLGYDPEKSIMEEVQRIDQLIKPNCNIPLEVSKIHGIYDKDVADKPSMQECIHEIRDVFHKADVAVAHNLEFDQKLLNIELERLGLPKQFLPKQIFDTMKLSTDMCKIPNKRGGHKYPKLEEVYMFLFGKNFSGAHNAIYDVEATVHVLGKLIEKDIITPKEP